MSGAPPSPPAKMRLRRKLIVLQLSIIAVLTTAILVMIAVFFYRTLPLMEQGIETKTRSCLHSLLRDVDVGLAAADRKLVKRIFARCEYDRKHDPYLTFIVVLDQKGAVFAARGHPPGALRTATRTRITRTDAGYRGYAPVSLEGVGLGTVVAEYSTHRVRQWERMMVVFSAGSFALVLLSALAAVFFAVHLIRPLREMTNFVHRVAGGDLEGRLDVKASDELALLAGDLNVMTTRLRQSRTLLADASRSAGRADIAAAMLHNVGNVLNSVNVSADLVAERVRSSKVSSVRKIADLLAEHEDDLPGFFAGDRRARRLPELVAALADHLAGEQEATLAEVQSLQQNVANIGLIISTQQEHAKAVDVRETVRLQEVVETAVDVNTTSLKRNGVVILREYGDIPTIETDRHKVLQILVNLLSNADRALEACAREDRVVEIKLKRREDDRVSVSVIDNGVGIVAEHLRRVFERGFTTREGGHGLGLHSSALAAEDLGGSLSCESDGAGRGATFTLKLPVDSVPAVES